MTVSNAAVGAALSARACRSATSARRVSPRFVSSNPILAISVVSSRCSVCHSRERRAGLIEAQSLVTDLRIVKADLAVEGILLACTREHGAGGVQISAFDVRQRHVECEVRSRRS